MPIYEFYSPDTNKVYSFFARSLSQGEKCPRCPDKPGAKMERMVSRFAVTGRASEKSAAAPDPGAPRMERVMAEMEREMSGLDESNPDPRSLGRMMRKMTEATGQAMPKEMEQMIRRLESGEDPEKLEEEFGDVFEGMDLPDEGNPGIPGAPRHTVRRPVRDPALYEMAEFI
ncbi:MAG: cytochrome C [Verrucomicrobiae bacterium]